MSIPPWVPLSLALLVLVGCETQRAIKQSDELRQKGDIVRSVEVLQAEANRAPDDVQLRTAQFSKLELLVAQYSREASAATMRRPSGPWKPSSNTTRPTSARARKSRASRR